jgi:hypothetical protein
MVPETMSQNRVMLYRACDYPTGWTCDSTLLEGGPFNDASLFHHDGRWWMFVETSDHIQFDTLRLYHADDLRGPWSEHVRSPVVDGNATCARPAGRVVSHDGRLFRFAQDCATVYGRSVSAFEILSLDDSTYLESRWVDAPLLEPAARGWKWLACVRRPGDGTTWVCIMWTRTRPLPMRCPRGRAGRSGHGFGTRKLTTRRREFLTALVCRHGATAFGPPEVVACVSQVGRRHPRGGSRRGPPGSPRSRWTRSGVPRPPRSQERSAVPAPSGAAGRPPTSDLQAPRRGHRAGRRRLGRGHLLRLPGPRSMGFLHAEVTRLGPGVLSRFGVGLVSARSSRTNKDGSGWRASTGARKSGSGVHRDCRRPSGRGHPAAGPGREPSSASTVRPSGPGRAPFDEGPTTPLPIGSLSSQARRGTGTWARRRTAWCWPSVSFASSPIAPVSLDTRVTGEQHSVHGHAGWVPVSITRFGGPSRRPRVGCVGRAVR